MMRRSSRPGKANQMMVAVVPPLVFIVALMFYSAYKWVAPSPFTLKQSQLVEAIEVINRIRATTDNGLTIPQAASLRAGGSSRVVVSRAHDDGEFLLVSGVLSAGFMQEKNPLDKMLHLKFDRSTISVKSDGERLDAVVLLPRHETNPMYVDVPASDPDVSPMDLLFPGDSIGPLPDGMLYTDKFESDNGMVIETTIEIGQSGKMGILEVAQFNFQLDADSEGWVEAPRTIRVQHKAVGTEDLEIAVLVPRDAPGSGPFQVLMFGEEVASIPRR